MLITGWSTNTNFNSSTNQKTILYYIQFKYKSQDRNNEIRSTYRRYSFKYFFQKSYLVDGYSFYIKVDEERECFCNKYTMSFFEAEFVKFFLFCL